MPDAVAFGTKWQLALGLLDRAHAAGLPALPVLADAGYGDCHDFRRGLRERALPYAVGIQGRLVFWGPGRGPVPPPPEAEGRDRPRVRWTSPRPPETAEALELALHCRAVTWREGSRGPQCSRFATVRVRTAHEHARGQPPGEEEWLLCECPKGETKPTKFWLCSLPADTPLRTLVQAALARRTGL